MREGGSCIREHLNWKPHPRSHLRQILSMAHNQQRFGDRKLSGAMRSVLVVATETEIQSIRSVIVVNRRRLD